MGMKLGALSAIMAAVLLQGCASPLVEAVGNVGKSALELVGVVEKEAAAKGKKVQLTLSAGESVNSDSAGRGNALVVRFYKLKAAENFLSLSREALNGAAVVPEGLKEDVLAGKEQILMPGQQYRLDEVLPAEASHIGVVMLFQSPQPARWRAAIPVAALSDRPLVLGVHRCSFTVTDGLSDKELLKVLSRAGSASCG